MIKRRWLCLLPIICLLPLIGSGCAGPPDAAVDKQPLATVPVQFAGCPIVLGGGVCALGEDRTLRLWIPDGVGGAGPLWTDGGPLPLPVGDPIEGGIRYTLEMPASVRWLEQRDPADQPSGEAADQPPDKVRPRFHLVFRSFAPHSTLREARRLRALGQPDAAEATLRQALPDLSGHEYDRALALLARLNLQAGRIEPAVEGLRRSFEAARSGGRLSEAVDDAEALAYALTMHQRRPGEARAVLEQAEMLAADAPESAARLPYFLSLVAASMGDTRGSLRALREAETRARRLGMANDVAIARQEIGWTLANLGRAEEAVALLRAMVAELPPDGDRCARAKVFVNLAWYAVLDQRAAGREGAARQLADPWPLLSRARAEIAGCDERLLKQVLLLNEALYAVQTGEVALAADRLDQLRRIPGKRSDDLVTWEIDVEAQVALARRHRRRAQALYARGAELARAQDDDDGYFRALVGQGLAWRALGDDCQAARSYRDAEAVLERQLAFVPLGEGRSSFLELRDESARQLVAALADGGDPAGALRAARLARARVLAAGVQTSVIEQLSAEQRSRWEQQLSTYQQSRSELESLRGQERRSWGAAAAAIRARRQEQERHCQGQLDELQRLLEGSRSASARSLRDPQPGELFLMYFPVEDGWLGLAATASGVSARRLPSFSIDDSPPVLAARLLASFDDQLEAADTVRFFPYGALERVDLHALSWRGSPLVAQRRVEYAVDLPVADASRPPPPGPGRALLVADPRLNLPAAGDEAAMVQAALRGWSVSLLHGDHATRRAVLQGLGEARLFHFAGHGWFGGRDGIESALGVAQGGQLLVGDIMTLARAPEIIVLSACEAGQTQQTGARTGQPAAWSLAHAFVAAGARAVVAPTRPVLDAAASETMRVFYAELGRAPEVGATEALRAAQSQLFRQGTADWSNFRVMVP